ncbi:hypothetical protein J3A83DRAFT_4084876, partial [Scleroderma citrinum]
VFTNISAITSRCSSLHHNSYSCSSWYDILASVGNYKDCILHIPSLGINLMYGPGTVVTFSDHLLQHGVNSVEGNRYCLTYYMMDNIHNFIGVAKCDWIRMENVEHLLLPNVNQNL